MLELRCNEVMNLFQLRSRASVSNYVRSRGWDFKEEPMPQGGRRLIYLVPEDQLPAGGKSLIRQEERECTVFQEDKPVEETLPVVLNEEPVEYIPYRYESLARMRAALCERIDSRLDACKSKTAEWKVIEAEYNQGEFLPELLKIDGKRSERCLRLWHQAYIESGRDMFVLVRKTRRRQERTVSQVEQDILLNILLHPNRVAIGSAITALKQKAALGAFASPSNERTLRRWCEDWKRDNPAKWAQAREGSKYVSEKIVKSIIRDSGILQVGDVFVADGHVLAFDILDPETGKPKRMTLILVFDWACRYPVGASLANSENSQHICIAFRNAFLHWGGLPLHAYLDNGRAFKAKIFHERWEEHDLELEMGGIFPRLGINATFARKYNARSKVIERFFQTFQEQFERFISTFRGASVGDKPATLMRNEKWARKLYEGKPPTVEETLEMITFYCSKLYGMTPHRGIKGRKPFEVFTESIVPDERKVEATRLHFLMLASERKRVRSEGVRLHKMLYWHDRLIDHVGKQVHLRFDLSESRWVLVFDDRDNFICQAELRQTQHPFIKLDPDNRTAMTDMQREYNQIQRHRKRIEQSTKQTVKRTQEAVDSIPLIRNGMKAPEVPLFNVMPMIAPPEPRPTIDQIAKRSIGTNHRAEPPENVTALENQEPQIEVEDYTEYKPKPKTFQEMLKAIGIK
jgi:putative transposase